MTSKQTSVLLCVGDVRAGSYGVWSISLKWDATFRVWYHTKLVLECLFFPPLPQRVWCLRQNSTMGIEGGEVVNFYLNRLAPCCCHGLVTTMHGMLLLLRFTPVFAPCIWNWVCGAVGRVSLLTRFKHICFEPAIIYLLSCQPFCLCNALWQRKAISSA